MHPNQNPNAQQAAANLQQAVQNLVAQNPQAAQVPAQQLAAAVPGQGRGRGAWRGRGGGRGGGGVGRGAAAQPPAQPGWDMTKCQWGVPQPFGPHEAQQAVLAADFTNSVFIQTSAGVGNNTRKAYTYVTVGNFQICVVGDIHPQPHGPAVAGHAFIPGFANWQTMTPAAAVQIIDQLPDMGAFPGNNRYPH